MNRITSLIMAGLFQIKGFKKIPMIKQTILMISILVSSCFGHSLKAQNGFLTDKIIPQSAMDTLKKYALTYPDETQFSIAIVKNKKVSFIGVKKKKRTLIFIDNKDSVFEIGSITKVFTSTILVDLILNGKINPDEPISETLPFKLNESEKEGRSITYKMLSNHTSGIPNFPDSIDEYIRRNPENPFVDYDNKKFVQYLKTTMKLNFVPGTQYDYSNQGAALLGYLIEIKTGQHFDKLLQSMVFSKYNMVSSTIDKGKVGEKLVKGHDETGKPVLNWDCNAITSAGACLSTVNDLSKFVLANFSSDAVLRFQQQPTFRVENNALDLGYAWHIFRNDGVVWYFHNGGTGGYHSNITMDVEKKCAVIILTNCTYEPEERYLEKISWKILKTTELAK
jgi:CubicO group peptidase (beta-lactamase class C family)